MMTVRQLAAGPQTLPTQTTWYLTDLAEAKGKQELYTRQSPQKLKVLRQWKAAGRIECLGRGPGAKWRKRVVPLQFRRAGCEFQ